MPADPLPPRRRAPPRATSRSNSRCRARSGRPPVPKLCAVSVLRRARMRIFGSCFSRSIRPTTPLSLRAMRLNVTDGLLALVELRGPARLSSARRDSSGARSSVLRSLAIYLRYTANTLFYTCRSTSIALARRRLHRRPSILCPRVDNHRRRCLPVRTRTRTVMSSLPLLNERCSFRKKITTLALSLDCLDSRLGPIAHYTLSVFPDTLIKSLV